VRHHGAAAVFRIATAFAHFITIGSSSGRLFEF
jgi:hypothetical protein